LIAVRAPATKDLTGSFRYGTWASLFVAIALVGCAGVEKKPAGPPPAGFVRGAVVADNALTVSLQGVEIRVEDQAVVAGEGGAFSLPRLSPGKQFLVAEKRFSSGPVRRAMGIAVVYVSDNPIELKIRMRDATDIDAFCSDCHPMLKNVTRKDQIFRDVHPSGIVPKKANKPTGKFDAEGKVTCESCHTVHRATGSPHFTSVTYKDGKLCAQCH
jgi:predicted CXXCH cytochrome family protein